VTDVLGRPPAGGPVRHRRPRQRLGDRGVQRALVLSVAIGNGALLAPTPLRLAGALWLTLLLPTWLIRVRIRWETRPAHAWLLSVAVDLLAIMLIGLVANQVLPVVGVSRPLDTVPVLLTTDLAVAGLLAWRWHVVPQLPRIPSLTGREGLLLGTAAVVLLLGVAGPIRLNNGLSGDTTLAMLVLAGVLIAVLARWITQVRPTTTLVVVYVLSLSLLLMTSLRGWEVTGHDIQRELEVLRLTQSHGSWDPDRFSDAYNACLSLTILPTVLSQLTGIPALWVFKVLFPVLFALCPVQVYLLARRTTAPLPAMLASVFFIGFPTYFTDMPFLNRQQIAFVFVGAILLVISEGWTVRRRQVWMGVLTVGLTLSHYSTMYVLLAVCMGSWLLQRLGPFVIPLLRRLRLTRAQAGPRPLVAGVVNIVAMAALAALWAGPVTHTGDQVGMSFAATVAGLNGADGDRSTDVAYSLFSVPPPPSWQEVVDEERARTLAETAKGRADGGYLPAELVEDLPIQAKPPTSLPFTALGRWAVEHEVDVAQVNDVMRAGAARLLQVLVVIGLLTTLLGAPRALRVTREGYALAASSFAVIAAQVLLPAVSAEYGVLRAFQQGLFLLAPFIVAAAMQVLGLLGRRAALGGTTALAITFFWSLTGVLPQSLGGYPAQLHLNNTGDYYDYYYGQPLERAGIAWLQRQVTADRRLGLDVGVAMDEPTFDRSVSYSRLRSVDNAFPTLIGTDQYVLLGRAAVREDEASFEAPNGDLVTYLYPIHVLDQAKDLIYDNGDVRVYR
jgi:uncharacterized membrane protein